MTTNETHEHRWTVNHDKGFAECFCGAQAMGVTMTQQPDALTRLERWARCHKDEGMLDLISEAREEMEALRNSREGMRGERDMARTLKKEADAVAATLSAKSSESLRMGQQQGRVELAQALLDGNRAEHGRMPLPAWAFDVLQHEVKE